MKSSTNRALVAKKHSTFSAVMANNLLTVLQGYSKTIRLLLVMFLTLTASTAWGAEEIVYTLTPASGSNNGYAGSCDITIADIQWNLTGNSQMQPWRIGGKSITNAVRTLYSKTAISDNVTKIEVTYGSTMSLTSANAVLKVYSTAESAASGGSTNLISTVPSSSSYPISSSGNHTFTRPAGHNWTGRFYRFEFTCTYTSGNSNKFFEFSEADFYAETASCTKIGAPTVTATPGDGRIDLSWSNQTGASSYSVTKTPSGGSVGTPSKSGSTWSCAITGLTNGTTYTWSVEAVGSGDYCASGNTAASASATPNVFRTITYYDKDGQHTTSLADGTNIADALDALYGVSGPTSCDAGNYGYFVGWKVGAISGTASSVTLLYDEVVNASSPSNNYYAVWSDTDPEASGGWTKVGDDELAVGDKVVFVYVGAANKEMTGVASNLGTATSITTIPDDITGDYVLTVEAGYGGSGYSFKNGSNYLSYSGSSNNLYTSTTKNNSSSWTISTSTSGNYKFANVETTSRILQYNSGSPRWACYTSSQTAFQIYKQSAGGAPEYITTCDTDPCASLQAPIVTATATANSITLSWATVPGATSYNVYNYTTEDAEEVNVLTYTFNGLDPETEYEWGVESIKDECSKETRGTTTTQKACTDAVTISKGTETNGTFTLSTTGQQSTCNGSVTVTLSDIEPATGYQFSAITQTGINSGVTIDNTAKTVTYAQNTSGTSTINVTFIAIPKYTVTLNPNYPNGKTGTFTYDAGELVDGNLVFTYDYNTASKTLADLYTSLTLDGYEFGGWYNAKGANPGEVSGSKCTTTGTITGNKTYYAKWSKLHTVTFNAGSGTCDDESLKETSGGAGVTLPTANPPAACATDGWNFAGWWTGSVAETTTSPGELLTAGSNYKPASDCTLYAVYSYTEAGGGGSGFYLSVTKDATTYYIGEKGSGSYLRAVTDVNSAATFNIENNQYLYYGNKTYVSSTSDNTSLTIATTTPSATWAITDEGETITFKSNGEGGRYLAFNYNSGSPRFSSYGSTYTYELTKHTTSTTTYNSNPTCLEPVWETNAATIDKTSFTVNCGERSPMTGPNGAAIISFPTEDIRNFTKDITIEATTGFLVSTNQSVNANYQSSVSLSPLVGTTNANTFYDKHVYVRAEAPAQSDTDLEGTITIKNNKGETLQTFSVTADVTCTTYTLTLDDRGTETTAGYYAGASVPKPEDPTGVCTDPINYVFDGWSLDPVTDENTTSYEKVSFPYTMPAKATTLYAVYRYLDDGGADSGDYVKVTENLDDYSGDYLIVYEAGSLALNGALVGDELDASGNSISVTITDNTIVATDEVNASNFTIAKEDDDEYSIRSASGYYIGQTTNANDLKTNSTEYYANTITLSNDDNADVVSSGAYLRYNAATGNTNLRFRYYKSDNYTSQKAIALYRKAASYLYTTSPVCGPHLAITEGKEIYVTGGNADGTRDLVIAQQKVSYKATRLQTSNGLDDGTAPDVKVATNGITVGGVVTSDVKVTIDQTKEQQTDGTYTITGTITVQYQPSANNKQEDIQVQLAVDYNAEARDNFTVHARSLPSEFVIVAKSGDKWYALNGDMNTNAANPANGQVTLDNDDNPTKATYAPCNTIYTFDGLPNTGDRTYVRFQGTDGAWLWAASGTNVGIQNNVLKTTPEGNNNAYNWKLYTQDNITYQFGNANSNRQLTLNGEKFGMYASGVQDIRILPYVEKCLYNYAPTNLKVSVLKGTYVTLTWDAVAGATKYQYSIDATNWNDAGTEPTFTINGLTGATEYTYYIRAYHEDAGVSQKCIDYAEITFTTADCDDVPTDITYTADLNSITVSWTASAQRATIKLYSDENGEHAIFIQNETTSPWKISTLSKNTTYYLQIFSNGTCASPIIPVKTEDVEVDIVEWQPQGIIVDINTDETVGVTLENEVSYGSGLGTEATELFFSKYYEASYNVKLVAIYNGTKNIIDLTDYTIQYGKTSWESNYITLKDFGATKGQIQPGEEIILYSMQDDSEDDDIMDCVHEDFPDGNWVRVTSNNNDGKGTLSFGGDKTIILCKTEYDDEEDEYYDNIIDVIGALKDDPNEGILPSKTTEKPSWGDKEGWVCETGLSIADDSQIGISTNRCLLIRNNTVTSGDNAVASNMNDFVTLCTEWKGAHVPDDVADNGVQASCDNFAYVGTFDYSDYYTKYESMGEGTTFEENDRNPDGTVTIPIEDLYKHACSNIRVKLTNSNSEVLSDREYKVPIMITTTQGTDGQTFLDLQQNLATKEVDNKGNVIATHPLSLEDVREICKTCDVVVRDNATLTKVTDGTTNDHPQVHDVIVYEGASIVIPDGNDHNYTINSLSLRRKGDEVASAQVQGTGKFVLPADVPVTLSMRIDANNWHWFTLPYDCDIADVTWSDGTPAKYNTDWFLMYYDGESRAASTNPYDNHWKVYNGATIEAGKGYILGITGNLAHPNYTFELCFPMAQDVLTAEQTNKTVALNAWGVKSGNKPNNLGWNLVGNPYLNYYKTADEDEYSLAGLPLIHYIDTDPVTGEWNYENSGYVPYVVTPIDGGWYEYRQELASDVQMMPFTAYFVQVGDPANPDHTDGKELNASFEASNRGKKSILRRAQSEVDEQEEPAIVAVELTNAKGESDKTTLLIADRFTSEYEMNADFFKWFGDYYTYYTKPVLYTVGADQGKRAFNALNEELATQPVALGMYAAQAGEYTFTLNQKYDLSRVEEVWLYDATENVYTNLMQQDYTFSTTKVNGEGRFSLSVKMMPELSTEIENIKQGNIWATTRNNEIVVNGLSKDMQLWIYDATGKLLHSDRTTNYQHSYGIPQTGAYFIRVHNNNEAQTIAVVVE